MWLAMEKVFIFATFALSSIFFLELIEYIEHYGLIYRSGKDEGKVEEICSWNAEENMVNNWMSFKFQRHSDHHVNAYKIFTSL